MSKCAPFFWSTGFGSSARVLHNGTICYVRTGQRDIGITADHVYKKFLRDSDVYPDLEAQFGGSIASPKDRRIDDNASLDLATFEVPKESVGATGKSLHTPAGWPPPALQKGQLVLYGGYPGALKESAPGQMIFPFQSFTWLVTDVTPTNIVMHVDFPNLYWPGHESEQINEQPGGISGGPVFRVIEVLTARPIRIYLELTGIVYEYHESMQVTRARHIRHVLADGTLLPL